MSGFSTNTSNLIRANLWSNQIKEVLLDELYGMRYVHLIQDFPDGTTLNIPSIGLADSYDYVEGQPIKYTAMTTGNFTFTITDYKASATYITNKMKEDSFYMSRLVSSFVPKEHRAIMKAMELSILKAGPTGQTASNPNTINQADHRWVAAGTSNVITPKDFAQARYALWKAYVPMVDLVALVDPSVEYTLSTLTNLTNVSFNPRWEGIIRDGMSTGTKFLMNIYGFDVYVTDNLQKVGAETITQSYSGSGAKTTVTGAANLFFSAKSDVLPFVGLMRQPPRVDTEYNKDYQREEYVTTCRYGFKLYRPENLVTILTDPVIS